MAAEVNETRPRLSRRARRWPGAWAPPTATAQTAHQYRRDPWGQQHAPWSSRSGQHRNDLHVVPIGVATGVATQLNVSDFQRPSPNEKCIFELGDGRF